MKEVDLPIAADMLLEMIAACGLVKSSTTGILHGIHWAELECPEFKPKRKGAKMTVEESQALPVGTLICYCKFWFSGRYQCCAGGFGPVVKVTSAGVTVNFEQTRGRADVGSTFFAHDEMARFCTAIGVQNP